MNGSVGLRSGRVAVGARARTIVIVTVTAIAIGVATYLIDQPPSSGFVPSGFTGGAPPQVGEKLLAFEARTPEGTTVRLADYAGRPIWLSFGATWCHDCRAEATDVEAAYLANEPKGLVVLSVWVRDDPANVTAFAAKNGLTFPKVLDPDERIAYAYRLLGYPTHFFVSPDGVIRVERIGRLTPEEMARYIAQITGSQT